MAGNPPPVNPLPPLGEGEVNQLNAQNAALNAAYAASAANPNPLGGNTTDTSMILFMAMRIMIGSMTGLNSYLKNFSDTVLSSDLLQDQNYANQLSAITLKPATTKGGDVSVYNQNQLMRQSVLQARLKTHQNQEQLDIQTASTVTSNMQQLASVISSLLDMMSQIFGSVNTLNR